VQWYEELYQQVDDKNMDAVGQWFAEDIVMAMGNADPVVGRTQVVEALRGFQATLAGLRHTFISAVENGDHTMLETNTHFDLLTGGSLELKGVTVIERRDGKITAQRMYVDMAPLWAAQARDLAPQPA
jgi:ketosteroid isomerase-like protein